MKAVVAGGGIGGLASAVALRNAGHEVEVYQRAAALEQVGAGLSLAPNALAALDRLGIGNDVRATPDLRRPPIGEWWHGRVTLLGNAAHPMTPNLGQGAAQALEDAVVLAEARRSRGRRGRAPQVRVRAQVPYRDDREALTEPRTSCAAVDAAESAP